MSYSPQVCAGLVTSTPPVTSTWRHNFTRKAPKGNTKVPFQHISDEIRTNKTTKGKKSWLADCGRFINDYAVLNENSLLFCSTTSQCWPLGSNGFYLKQRDILESIKGNQKSKGFIYISDQSLFCGYFVLSSATTQLYLEFTIATNSKSSHKSPKSSFVVLSICGKEYAIEC